MTFAGKHNPVIILHGKQSRILRGLEDVPVQSVKAESYGAPTLFASNVRVDTLIVGVTSEDVGSSDGEDPEDPDDDSRILCGAAPGTWLARSGVGLQVPILKIESFITTSLPMELPR